MLTRFLQWLNDPCGQVRHSPSRCLVQMMNAALRDMDDYLASVEHRDQFR